MGWHSLHPVRAGAKTLAACAALGLALVGTPAEAQGGGTGDDLYVQAGNAYLNLFMGAGKNVGGSIAITTTANNPTAPNQAIAWNGPLRPASPAPILGSHLYLRVDGGRLRNGYDYVIGDLDAEATEGGVWVVPPTVQGNRIEAVWRTKPIVITDTTGTGGGQGGGGGGTTTTITYDPRIEVRIIGSFVHDTVRFQFVLVNNELGRPHTVGLAFVQDIEPQPNQGGLPAPGGGTATPPQKTFGGAPLRLPDQPYLRRETLLIGAQVPRTYETFVQLAPATPTSSALVHSIRGTLRPNAGVGEPTPPNRFVYGRVDRLNGYNFPPLQRDFTRIFEFQPDPTIDLDRGGLAALTDAGVGLYWDDLILAPGQNQNIVTYLGQATSSNDFAPPIALSVESPIALGFNAPGGTTGTGTVTPNPFQITAYVTNLSNLSPTGGFSTPVNLTLDLPEGLELIPGETVNKPIQNISPGGEVSVAWAVRIPEGNTAADRQRRRGGLLTFRVAATPGTGAAKNVSRQIEVPAPAAIATVGNDLAKGLFQMITLPLQTGAATPSVVLGLSATPPEYDLVRYNPLTSQYEPVNAFQPGFGYWFRSRRANSERLEINPVTYPPLDNQVGPSRQSFTVSYPRGWNQVGNPYVYGIRFSEIQVFDPETLELVTIDEAAAVTRQWVLPAVYRYDTSDPDPRNWGYDLLDNFGFVLQPFEGYWILVRKSGLQFIYPGADTPGGSVTRSALLGVGLGAKLGRTSANNWRLKLVAQGDNSADRSTYIGVAPTAKDGLDIYEYNKPPVLSNLVSLDLVVAEDKSGTRYAQDLRSPAKTRKTWDLMVHGTKADETVTVTWPGLAASVPRDYRLTLVDPTTNTRRDMRTSSSYAVKTGVSATRALQIVAEPGRSRSRVAITRFDVEMGRTRADGSPTPVAINYAFSEGVNEARLVIRDGRGRTVRVLPARTRAAGDAPNGTASWDLRDDRGTALPTGPYAVELVVMGEDGGSTRQVRPVNVTR